MQYVVGEKFPFDLQQNITDGGNYFQCINGQYELVLFWPRPSKSEIHAVKEGVLEFGLYIENEQIILLFRAEHQQWSDSPTTMHRVDPQYRVLPDWEPLRSHLINIVLVDATTQTIQVIRRVNLGAPFSYALYLALKQQMELPYDTDQYDRHLDQINRRYPTQLLAENAHYYTIGGVGLTVYGVKTTNIQEIIDHLPLLLWNSPDPYTIMMFGPQHDAIISTTKPSAILEDYLRTYEVFELGTNDIYQVWEEFLQAIRLNITIAIREDAEEMIRRFQAQHVPTSIITQRMYAKAAQERPNTDLIMAAKELLHARTYRLTPSAFKMLAAVYTPDNVPTMDEPVFFEFDHFQLYNYQLIGIAWFPIGEDEWCLSPIHERYLPIAALVFRNGKWTKLNPETCLAQQCTEEKICAACQGVSMFFVHWLATAQRMVRRDYATTPEPPVFATIMESWTDLERVPRNKNPNDIKVVPKQRQIQVTIIGYEVSELPPRDQEMEIEDAEGTKRLWWVRMYGSDQVIYVARHIVPNQRRYPRRRDGTRKEGVVEVKEYDVMVPMLAIPITTIRKVEAKRFE